MELAPGVVTPGWFDLRGILDVLPWPDVEDKRCLDVGTYDGQLAFELERVEVAVVSECGMLGTTGTDPVAAAECTVSVLGVDGRAKAAARASRLPVHQSRSESSMSSTAGAMPAR